MADATRRRIRFLRPLRDRSARPTWKVASTLPPASLSKDNVAQPGFPEYVAHELPDAMRVRSPPRWVAIARGVLGRPVARYGRNAHAEWR